MKPGSTVTYRGTTYYYISGLGGIAELAPTPHGAGSFLIAADLIQDQPPATVIPFPTAKNGSPHA